LTPHGAVLEESRAHTGSSHRIAPWLILAAILLCTSLIRIRLRDIPLERDEGEYALAGQLMLHGIPPYQEAWNMKFPGTYAAYAAIMSLLGQSIPAIHMGLMAINALTTVLLFAVARRFMRVSAALAACAAFALLSVGEGVLGPMAHATHFVILFALAGTVLLLRATERQSWWDIFFSGICFGIAVLMKQHGVFFGVFAGFWLLWTSVTGRTQAVRSALVSAARKIAVLAGGAALPIALTFLVLWKVGVFERFWFWTFRYAREYAGENTLADGWWYFKETAPDVIISALAFWILAAAGLIVIWFAKNRQARALPLTLFLIFSILAVCPGLYFREHYFVLMLPALALLTGAAFEEGLIRLPRHSALVLFALAVAATIWQQRDFFFQLNPIQASLDEYGITPFPAARSVAAYIRAHTPPDARIAVLGSEPEIYFYADRRPATGYMYTYALMEAQPYAITMQNDMIHEIEQAKPEYIVMVGGDDSWIVIPESPKRIFEWWKVYEKQHYSRVGVVDIVSDRKTDYWWDAAAATREPAAKENLVISRRIRD
jgi:hypothetical protein